MLIESKDFDSLHRRSLEDKAIGERLLMIAFNRLSKPTEDTVVLNPASSRDRGKESPPVNLRLSTSDSIVAVFRR